MRFDALVREAREQLYGPPDAPRGGDEKATWADEAGRSARRDERIGEQETELCRGSRNGETRTRTGDTTIFSRVLYQLSYLAVMG